MPYYNKVIRRLPIEFSIEFNLKECHDFYARIDYIRNFLESKKDKILTFNNESKGFKLYWIKLGDIKRSVGSSTINISFQCYPDIYSLEN